MLKQEGDSLLLRSTRLPPSVAMIIALMLQMSLSKLVTSSGVLGYPIKTNLLRSSWPDQMIGPIKEEYMSRVNSLPVTLAARRRHPKVVLRSHS
jgi:hypothetical protein